MHPLDKPAVQFGLAVLTVAVLPLFLTSGILATEILIFAMVVAACNLLLGYTGLLSFGQGIFFGVGTYAAGICLTRWQVPVPLVQEMYVGAVATGEIFMAGYPDGMGTLRAALEREVVHV